MTEGSRLFYHGTREEVCLGDRVRVKRLLRKDLHGVVCYIPGISRPHRLMYSNGVHEWAIRYEDGSVCPIVYDPDNFQPPSKFSLQSRGPQEKSLNPDEELL